MTFTESEAMYLPILVAAFMRYDLPPEWGPAFARVESSFVATAVNNSAGDASRGGSRGLCQMSLLTARGLGFTGTPNDLLDPLLNADYAARLCSELVRRFKTRELTDIAAGYNSGKTFLKAPTSTRFVYVPRVRQYASVYKARATTMAAAMLGQAPSAAPPPGS